MRSIKLFNKIDTVHGFCEECEEDSILVAIVQDYYRCTNCGHDTRQYMHAYREGKKVKYKPIIGKAVDLV